MAENKRQRISRRYSPHNNLGILGRFTEALRVRTYMRIV